MPVIRDFPKRTFTCICAARCLIGIIGLCMQLHAIFGKGHAPLTRGALIAPILQLIVGGVGLFSTSRQPDKPRSWMYLLISLLPVVTLFYPVTYLTPFYFYEEWGGGANYGYGTIYDKHIAMGQYVLCVLDTLLGLSSLSLVAAGLRKPTLARMTTTETTSRNNTILITGVLHFVLFFVVFGLHAFGHMLEGQTIKFVSYIGLVLCVNYFFLLAFVASVTAYILNEKYSVFHCYFANLSSLLSCFTYFLVCGFGGFSIYMDMKRGPPPEEEPPVPFWLYPMFCGLVGAMELAISSLGIHTSRNLFKKFNVISVVEDNEMKSLNA